MNTKIISISDDQNTITHESGVVTEFFSSRVRKCSGCAYKSEWSCINVPCVKTWRKDKKTGIFKLKTTGPHSLSF